MAMRRHTVKSMTRQCFSKRVYRSADLADKRARQLTERYKKKHRSYWCEICAGYHLSTRKETK